MSGRPAWDPPVDREWRGRPAVPALSFDRRSARERRASERLPLVVGLTLLAYPVLEPSLQRALGGFWGEVAVLVLTGAPIGAAWAASRGARGRSAWKTGALFAFASAAWYAWIFTGAWV